MPKQPKPSAAGATAKVKSAVMAQAVERLTDPEVQKQILEQGTKIVGSARKWLVKRPRSEGPSVTDRIGGRFGQKGLERRATNARAAVVELTSNSAALGAALHPVVKSLDEVDQLLVVAGSLPLTKRKRAHLRIDDVLDELESALFEAVLDGGTSDRDR